MILLSNRKRKARTSAKIFTAVAIFALLCSAATFAQDADLSDAPAESETRTLTIEQAVNYALENNVSIAQSQITLSAAKRSKNTSWNSVSPSMSVGAGLTIPTDDSNYDYSYNVNASISLSLTPNLYTDIKSAALAWEQGKITFDEAVRAIELSVRQTFYGLLYEKENIALQEENLVIAKSQYETNLAKYNMGRLSEIDVLSAEVNYKSKIPDVENSKITYENDIAAFKQLLGMDNVDEQIELTGSLDDYKVPDEVTTEGIEITSSTIKLLESQLESAKTGVLDARFSAYGPTLSAGWSWKNTWTEPGSAEENSSSITLSATIPLDGLLPWSARAVNIASAKDSVQDYELQLKDAKTSLQIDIDSALRSIKQSQAAISYRRANVELAQKSYEMTQVAYNSGTQDLLTLQTADATLLEAQVDLQNEIYTLITEVLDFEKLIGVPFGTIGTN